AAVGRSTRVGQASGRFGRKAAPRRLGRRQEKLAGGEGGGGGGSEGPDELVGRAARAVKKPIRELVQAPACRSEEECADAGGEDREDKQRSLLSGRRAPQADDHHAVDTGHECREAGDRDRRDEKSGEPPPEPPGTGTYGRRHT